MNLMPSIRIRKSIARILLLLGFGILIPQTSVGADDAKPEWIFKIRKDADDKNSIEKPARFSLTDPDDGSTTWAADVGLIVGAPPYFSARDGDADRGLALQVENALNFEYHRQTAPNNEQDALLAGLQTNFMFGTLGNDGGGWNHWIPVNVQYKRDDIKKNAGMQITADYLPVVSMNWLKLGQRIPIGGTESYVDSQDALRIEFQPMLGVEYDGVYDAPTGMSNGRTWRGHAKLEVSMFPLAGADLLDQRIQIFGSASYWYLLDASSQSMRPTGENADLFEVGVRYRVDDEGFVSIGVSYLDGENPRKGKPGQEYWQLAVEVKL